ncbi:orf88.CDS.1, partial (mitochondrion) [Saccharomyces cerevisiae]
YYTLLMILFLLVTGPGHGSRNPVRRNMHMDNKSLIMADNKLYNNTLLNKIKDTTFMSMKHFKNWLSGFVVGDGYFGIKKNMTHSFNIT